MKRSGFLAALACLGLTGCGDVDALHNDDPLSTEIPTVDATWSWNLACDRPVRAGQTPAELHAAFGKDARDEMLGGPEGAEIAGLVLWPDDPQRRLEIILDEANGRAAGLRVGPDSRWRVSGLAMGATLAEAQRANGRPFDLWGFSWDYGGYVSDLKGGMLADLPGGCVATLRFEPEEDSSLPDRTMGEVTLSSNDPALAQGNIRLSELGVSLLQERD